MKTFIVIISLALVLFTGLSFAEDQAEEVWKPMSGGSEYFIREPATIFILTSEPMIKDRLSLYGNVIIDKNRQRIVNIIKEKQVTETGMEIYNRVMALKNDRGLFSVFSCALEHTRITIIKYKSTSWDGLTAELDKILAILDEKTE